MIVLMFLGCTMSAPGVGMEEGVSPIMHEGSPKGFPPNNRVSPTIVHVMTINGLLGILEPLQGLCPPNPAAKAVQ